VAILSNTVKKITGRGRPTFYAEVVLCNKGMELLTDAWGEHSKNYFVILTYWHQIQDPYSKPKRVLTLAEVVICPKTLHALKKIEASVGKDTMFHIRRVDLEGYDGWDKFDYE
jgi:hypothetical protein